jgi:hypothetical protein
VPISKVNLGARIYTCDGSIGTVEKVFQRNYTGELITIKAHGWPIPLRVTPNHPLFVLRRDRCSLPRGTALNRWCWENCIHERRGTRSCHLCYNNYEIEKVPAGNLKPEEYCLVLPRKLETERVGPLIPDTYCNWNRPFNYTNSDFWWLVGLYLADGHKSGSQVVISLNSEKDKDIINKVCAVANSTLGCKTSIQPHGTVTTLHIHSARFTRFLGQFGRDCYSKYIPLEIINWLDKESARELIRGYVDGDGCAMSHQSGYRAISVSLNLLWSLRQLGFKFGWPLSVMNVSSKHADIGGRKIHSTANKWEIRIAGWVLDGEQGKSKYWFDEKNVYLPISSISTNIYSGLVYNLSVTPNHTYITAQVAAKNCDDLITQKNTLSHTMRQQITQTFWAELHKRVDPGGQVILSGSRFYTGDLYEDIKKNPDWKIIEMAAPVDKPLWPEFINSEQLRKESESNPLFYRAQYLQQPIAPQASLNPDWLSFYLEEVTPESLVYYIGVDPCDKEGGSDEFAAVVIGQDSLGQGYVVDILTGQYGLETQVAIVKELSELYRPA